MTEHNRHTSHTAATDQPLKDGSEPAGHRAMTSGSSDHDEHAGHSGGGHAGHADMFRIAFWRNLALAVPVLVFSTQIQDWFNYELSFPGSQWVAPVLGTVIYFYGGKPFLTGGIAEARSRQPGMMLLIALAITVAFASSIVSLTNALDLEFWWELASLIVIMLLGHWQEMKAIGQAQGALAALAELLPDEAERVTTTGDIETVAIADLAVGDRLLIRSGSRIPADGTIVDGSVEVDESMLTGESNPVAKTEGDNVVAGSVATDNSIRVEVTAIGDDTALGGIQRLVADAQDSKSKAQALADRAAAVLFYVAITAAVITAVVWLALGRPDDALIRTVTVLIIACPHALGLAIPLVISLSTAKAAENGILVKDRLALEKMRTVNTVLFDKTGTLTAGEHVVADFAAIDGDTDRMLALAAGVEGDSEHPLARAIIAKAEDSGIEFAEASSFQSMTGRGVSATIDRQTVAIGGPSLLRELDLTPPQELDDKVKQWEARGAAVLHLIVDNAIVGSFALEDGIRPESRRAVDALHERGIRVVIITGDSQAVADSVAAELGIDDVYAEVLPDDKDAAVKDLQSQGRIVAMVGDGVNDAPALARADVGLAIGAGTDVAIESAGVVLASSDPRAVLGVITLSVASYRKMIQNLIWAAGYNIAAIPLAAGVLAPIGIILPPAIGAALMSLSTIVVAANAQLLRRLDLRPDAH